MSSVSTVQTQPSSDMKFITDLIGMVSGKLEDAAQSDVVVGQLIDLGDVKIVPLSRLSVGMAVAGAEGEADVATQTSRSRKHRKRGHGRGKGGISGMGAKVRPVGLAIFTDDGVEVLPIANRKGILDKIFDKIPAVIEMVERATGTHAESADAIAAPAS